MTSERYYTYGAQSAAYRGGQPPRRSPAGARTMHRVQTGISQGDARGQAMRGRQAGVSAAQRRSGGPKRPQDGRRQPARRGRHIPAKARLALFALVTLLVVFGVVKLIGTIRTGAEERFVQNVYINGVCMTGYTKDEGYKLIHELRDNWLNSTYTLTFQDKSWTFSPSSVDASLEFDKELDRAWNLGHMGDRATRREIVRNLEQVPAEFVSQPTFDEKALDRFVESVADDVHVEPVDAEVTLTELKPVITRVSVNGWELDKVKLKENLVSLIETGKADLQLPVNEVQPVVMSDNMEMKVIAKVETDVTFRGYPSRTNVRLALEHFNLMSVYPGETISFNEVVGPRTEALGYQEAPEYAGITKEMGVGGGVCQASTTLYNAVIQAGMTVIQRHRHSMTVSYVDPSQDAAVAYGDKDFVFRNDTEHPIFIYTNVTKELASVTIYGTRPEYHYVLESVILDESESTKTGYEDDTEGKYVYYTTDPPVLYKKGRGSCESEGWIVSYDWETKQEVSRVQVNHDVYSAGVNVYWRGVHKPKKT